MNIMGIGALELAVILLVAFLVLGPGKSIDMAKRTGKVLGDLRRAFGDVTDAISNEERQRAQPGPAPGPAADNPPPPGIPPRPDLPDDDTPPPDTNAPNNDTPPRQGRD